MMKTVLHNRMYRDRRFIALLKPLLRKKLVQEMRKYPCHGTTDCYNHSIYVSYVAYRIGRKLRLDYRALVRAGMLHDLYLYDWHIKGERKGLHGMTHARVAFSNAREVLALTHKEQDMILTHMWPLNPTLPKYRESLVLMFADRFCTVIESLKLAPLQAKIFK